MLRHKDVTVIFELYPLKKKSYKTTCKIINANMKNEIFQINIMLLSLSALINSYGVPFVRTFDIFSVLGISASFCLHT